MHSNRLLLLLMLLLLPRGKLPLRELACHRRRRIGSRWLPLPFIAPPSHALTPHHMLAGNERVAGSSRRADARPCDGRGGRLRRLQVVRAHLECQSELAGLCRRFIRARWLMHAMMWCRMYCMPLAFWSCAAAYLSESRFDVGLQRPGQHAMTTWSEVLDRGAMVHVRAARFVVRASLSAPRPVPRSRSAESRFSVVGSGCARVADDLALRRYRVAGL